MSLSWVKIHTTMCGLSQARLSRTNVHLLDSEGRGNHGKNLREELPCNIHSSISSRNGVIAFSIWTWKDLMTASRLRSSCST